VESDRLGFDLDSTWIAIRPGFDLDSTWIRLGFDLDSPLVRIDMLTTWFRAGFDLASTWIRAFFGKISSHDNTSKYGRAQKYVENKLFALGCSSVVLYGVGDGMFAYCCLLNRIPCLIIYGPNPGGAVHQQVIRKHLVGKMQELYTKAVPGSKWFRSNTQLCCRPDDDGTKAQEEAIKQKVEKSPQEKAGAPVPEEPTPPAKRAHVQEEEESTPAKRAHVQEEEQEEEEECTPAKQARVREEGPTSEAEPKDSKSKGKETKTAVTPAGPPQTYGPPPEPPIESQPGPLAEPSRCLTPKKPKCTAGPSSSSSSSSSSSPTTKKNCPVEMEDEAAEGKD
jgi:hypothetical protein